MAIVRAAEAAGVKAASVQDKVYLPGFHKLHKLRDSGFFGRILSARLDSGWWVFDGESQPAQRSSWNYRKKDGGGLVLDMYPHWRYLLTSLIGPIKAVSCRKVTQIPRRIDEAGQPYEVDVEDEVFATFEFESGALAQVTSSWATRVKRDDLIQIQIDGTLGSAVAGGHQCFVQSLAATPKPAWNVEVAQAMDFDTQWQEVPDVEPFRNSYRQGWEQFLRHVAQDDKLRSPMLEGARDVQLTELCYQSDRERRWIDVPALT
jgi:predicted dehydrogenase